MAAAERDFLEHAERWLQSLRRALDEGRGDVVRDLAEALSDLQQEGVRLVNELRGTPGSHSERERLLEALRELRREAVVCSALFESDLITMRWALHAARPAEEYQPDGTVSGAATPSKQWSI